MNRILDHILEAYEPIVGDGLYKCRCMLYRMTDATKEIGRGVLAVHL